MPRIMIVTAQAGRFEALARALDAVAGVAILWARDGRSALEKAAAESPDLVVVDETLEGQSGLDWIRRLMGVDAFVQTAAVSSRPQDAFHQAAEGLGIMAQLPPHPGRFEAELLLKTLKQLAGTA